VREHRDASADGGILHAVAPDGAPTEAVLEAVRAAVGALLPG
jgi:hypothetical protein